MDSEIIIVSGLPRSGTSLMMQMLERGGVEVVTDNLRTADTDNPRGYYELEKIKKLRQDASWFPQTRGKAIKIVSQLLYELVASESYRIIFMQRDTDEILASQEKMLQRRNRPPAPRDELRQSYAMHLERLGDWLGRQRNMAVLYVSYSDRMEGPKAQAERVSEFLSGRADPERMAKAVDPSLYRNTSGNGGHAGKRSFGAQPSSC